MESDHEESGQMEFPSLRKPAIIAMKGLPSTYKTILASCIGKWARSPVLRIDDILDKLYNEGDHHGDSLPSGDEAERLHRLAFDTLCNVAAYQMSKYCELNCVITKSRLCSTFELDRLMQLAGFGRDKIRPHPLLIIECQVRNDHRWKKLYYEGSDYFGEQRLRWYRPKKWEEVEMASFDYDAQGWDSHFDKTIKQLPDKNQHLVRRLVVDAYNQTDLIQGGPSFEEEVVPSSEEEVDTSFEEDVDASFEVEVNPSFEFEITHPFADAVKYLLTGGRNALRKLPPVVELVQLQRILLEKEINAPRERSKYLCSNERGCVFKYRDALEEDEVVSRCGACENKASGPGYTCYFCYLTLHKSCAELDIDISESRHSVYINYLFPKGHACNSCREGGKAFSITCRSCIFQAHLKCRLMPTIVHHECHPEHFLSMQLTSSISNPVEYFCNGCGYRGGLSSYVCKFCKYQYHVRCVALPREVKHEHGGYKHVMKLMYSLDDEKKEEEDFWCDVCYKDMDPQLWFYSCQECPCYVAHMDIRSCLPCGTPPP